MELESNLEKLKKITGQIPGLISASQIEAEQLVCSQLPGAVTRSSITELSGPSGCGKSEVALKFISENTNVRVAWLENEMTAYPRAFPLHGVPLDRVLFCSAGEELAWTAQQILKSGLFPIVVISPQVVLTPTDLRRIQLATEQSRSTVILLSEKPTAAGAWTIRSQFQIVRSWALPQAHPLKLRKSA